MTNKSDNNLNNIENLSELERKNIELQQTLETGAKIPTLLFGNIVMGVLALFIIYDSISTELLTSWGILLILSIFSRIVLLINYHKVTIETLSYWNAYFILASFFSGLVWGAFGVILETSNQHFHGFEAFVLGGMAASALVTNSLIRWNYFVFIIAMFMPSIVHLSTYATHGNSIHYTMALMYFIFLIVFILNASNNRKMHFQNLLLVLLAKKSETLLQNSQKKLEETTKCMIQAQKIAHIGNWQWNMLDNTLWWSDEVYSIFGVKLSEFRVTYDNFMEMVHPDDITSLQDQIQKTIKENTPYTIKHRILLKDGAERIVMGKGRVFQDKNGRNLAMVGTVQDVTEEEKKNEELLIQSDILDSISDAVFVHDMDGELFYVNRATCKERGFSKEEFYTMKVSDLDDLNYFTEAEYQKHLESTIKTIMETGEVTFEMQHRKKDGSSLPVEIRSRLIKTGKKDYLISIARDVTEHKRIQRVLKKSELQYRSLVENSLVGVYISNIEDDIFYCNEALVNILEYDSTNELLSKNLMLVYKDPEVRVKLIAILKEKGFISNYEIELITKNGNIITVLLSANFDGHKFSGTIIDISQEKQIRDEYLKLSIALEQIDDIVMITDKKGVVEYVNESFTSHTGYSRDEVYGNKSNILKSNKHDMSFYKNLWETILSGEIYKNRIINSKKNGEIYYEQKTITPLRNEKDMIIGFISSAKDVTYNVQMEKELEKMARTDSLTGICNRNHFEETYEKEIERSKRYGTALSLIMLDIDHFKEVNDTYGHDVGDSVLKTLAEVVKVMLRKSDMFARFGGEEFMILCPETDAKKASLLANKIRESIENTNFKVAGKVTSSFGVTQYLFGEEKEQLLKRVDTALYKAKENGRNGVYIC